MWNDIYIIHKDIYIHIFIGLQYSYKSAFFKNTAVQKKYNSEVAGLLTLHYFRKYINVFCRRYFKTICINIYNSLKSFILFVTKF